MDPIENYYELVANIDKEAKRLTDVHGEAISCKPGCTACCVDLSVFPVEYHAIRRAIIRAGTRLDKADIDPSAPCAFLKEGLCRIYPFRPIICRTHGLPILFLDDSSGEYAWEVSFCELNFSGLGQIEFTQDTLLNIEDINEALSRINRDFSTLRGRNLDAPPTRTPLKALFTDFN